MDGPAFHKWSPVFSFVHTINGRLLCMEANGVITCWLHGNASTRLHWFHYLIFAHNKIPYSRLFSFKEIPVGFFLFFRNIFSQKDMWLKCCCIVDVFVSAPMALYHYLKLVRLYLKAYMPIIESIALSYY